MIFVGLLLSFGFLQAQQQKGGWELALSKDGIKVYTRKANNQRIKEFKAITTIQAPIDTILPYLLDVPGYVEWMNAVKEAKMLRKEENVFYSYSVAALPWPFDDRDQVAKTTVEKDTLTGQVVCNIEVMKEGYPEDKKKVRIKEGFGHWLLKENDSSSTVVEYRFYADPGGNLPEGIVNMFIEESPFKTLKALRKKIER
jgi:hypothetical protein